MRRYVTDYVNRHDFSVIPEFIAEDYTLHTGGGVLKGRDTSYRQAVSRQLAQFTGLVFTLHEIHHAGDSVSVRFTEHGASRRHDGRAAAWPSIAIYTMRDGKLASCSIEQDYFSRHRQLDTAQPMTIDPPAIAPWDSVEEASNCAAEKLVIEWLKDLAFLRADNVQVDDSRATGGVQGVMEGGELDVHTVHSCGSHVAFQGLHRGRINKEFGPARSATHNDFGSIHLTGLVQVRDHRIVGGNIIRDRWGLYRGLQRTTDGS